MTNPYPPAGQPDPYDSNKPAEPSNPGFGQPSGPSYGGYGEPPNLGYPGQVPPGASSGPSAPGGTGNPYAPQGPQGPQGHQGPYQPYGVGGPGSVPPGQKPPSNNTRLFIIVGAAVLALIVFGVGAGILLSRNDKQADPPIVPGGGDPTKTTEAPKVDKPSDAVRLYLEALASGNAEAALALSEDTPADKTFLTDAVLKASNDRAPITEINVPEVSDKYTYSVEATYKMGDQAVSEDFNVSESGGTWKLSRAYVENNFSYLRHKTLPMMINGVEVKTDKVRLFPGSYEFTTGLKNIDYGSENVLLIQSPSGYASATDIRPTLTEAGYNAFVKSAKTQISSCLKQKKLAPSGCPFGLKARTGQRIDEKSIVWTLKEDPFANLKAELDYRNPALAEASESMEFEFKATGTDNGRKGTFDQSVYKYVQLSADMTKDPVQVKFGG